MKYHYLAELYHHGVLGQKWGVRRYQNADGTLSALGRERLISKDGMLTKKGKKVRSDAEATKDKLSSHIINYDNKRRYVGNYGDYIYGRTRTNQLYTEYANNAINGLKSYKRVETFCKELGSTKLSDLDTNSYAHIKYRYMDSPYNESQKKG